jgi:hypothetical protein
VVRRWDDLREAWIRQVGLGIDTAEQAAVALIMPSQIAPVYFDDLAQQLVWPVRDEAGAWLALTLDHEEPVSPAITALEANVKSGWQGMVLVRLERDGERLSARPLTLFNARDGSDPVNLSLWDQPWRPFGEERNSVREWLDRLRPGAGRRFGVAPRSGTDAVLAKAWRHLIDRAEIGPSLARTLDAERAAHGDRIERLGLLKLAEMLRAAEDSAGLLAAAYALMLARQQRCGPTLLV